MNRLERVLAALEGDRKPDRVPTFSLLFDSKPINDALGLPYPNLYWLLENGFMQKLIDSTAWLWEILARPNIGGVPFFANALRADVKMGFDAGLAMFYGFRVKSHKELQDIAGRSYKFVNDGFGGIYAMYSEGTITDPEAWKRFDRVDPAKNASRMRRYFSFLNYLFGGKIAVVASPGLSMHQDITEGMGFTNFVRWTRKDPAFVRDIIDYKTELAVEGIRAIGESGIKVIWFGDDLAFRSGPMLSPTMLEDLFGDSYRRIAKAAHMGGVRIMFHTCGNVLDLLPMIADWGYDGVHALEPTAGVTIAEARKRAGDRLCLCGNVDITHTLVDAGREEVFEEVRECIRDGAKDGRFILAATNTHMSLNHRNLSWMVEAAHEYGVYPVEL